MALISVTPASTLRRGAARCGELLFLAQVLDSAGIWPGLMNALTGQWLAFVIFTMAGSAVYDLFDMVTRPDLSHVGPRPCNEETPLLPFEEDKE